MKFRKEKKINRNINRFDQAVPQIPLKAHQIIKEMQIMQMHSNKATLTSIWSINAIKFKMCK